jgi:hypothetical protein
LTERLAWGIMAAPSWAVARFGKIGPVQATSGAGKLQQDVLAAGGVLLTRTGQTVASVPAIRITAVLALWPSDL